MPKAIDPIFTQLGQLQRAQRRAAQAMQPKRLTEARINKSIKRFSAPEPEKDDK